MPSPRALAPGLILFAGCLLIGQAGRQESASLRAPLEELPRDLLGLEGQDVSISPEEQRIAGTSSYLLRTFSDSDSQVVFSIYVGYYESQTQGKAIHSPKNCLPGAGWEVLLSSAATVVTEDAAYPVNRYMISKDRLRALVYYWYQGRGRVSSNEYLVKWQLLRDKALSRRSEEALVRIVVPVYGLESAADSLAQSIATSLIPNLFGYLPEAAAR